MEMQTATQKVTKLRKDFRVLMQLSKRFNVSKLDALKKHAFNKIAAQPSVFQMRKQTKKILAQTSL